MVPTRDIRSRPVSLTPFNVHIGQNILSDFGGSLATDWCSYTASHARRMEPTALSDLWCIAR